MTTEFNVSAFENDLINLKDTQEGIQQMSSWCLQHRKHHKKIVSSWLNVLKQVRVDHRLTLFYLANDVIQYSKRKNYEFVDSWGTALQKATTMVRDEKVRIRVVRIFKIWKDREIYSDEYLCDLNGLLNMNPIKKNTQHSGENTDDFQNTSFVSSLNECIRLSSETDKNFKMLSHQPNSNLETVKNKLKDKTHTEDMEKEINNFTKSLDKYIKSLQSEISSRKLLISNIEEADKFYATQRGEVKVVVNAYKNFGTRIKNVKKKLEDLTSKLPSPIPSPDINAPSPEPDADINLPDESINANLFKSSQGYISYMDGNLPFDINDFKSEKPKGMHPESQAIQVINSRSEANNYDEDRYFKSSIGKHFSYQINNSPTSNLSQDLKYDAATEIYNPEIREYEDENCTYNQINASYTGVSNYTPRFSVPHYQRNTPLITPPPPVPPTLDDKLKVFNNSWMSDTSWPSTEIFNRQLDTPGSPPHFEREGANLNIMEYNERESIINAQDVDHRELSLAAINSEKIQHIFPGNGRPVDVDHRNLISLTGSPGSKLMESDINDKFNFFTKDNSSFESIKTNSDQDYRQQSATDNTNLNAANESGILKPPPYPPLLGSPLSPTKTIKHKHSPLRRNKNKSMQYLINDLGSKNDNVESIDMEMSDDDDQFPGKMQMKCDQSNGPEISIINSNNLESPEIQNLHTTENESDWKNGLENKTIEIMPNNAENIWGNQRLSLMAQNSSEDYPQQLEFRRFINPNSRNLPQKHMLQAASKPRRLPYFSRSFVARGGNFNNRGRGFRGRSWK